MPRVTPIFRLPYLQQDEPLTLITERTRFVTIDRQLEALYSFLGNGIITGWELSETTDIPLSITISPGSGVVSGVAAASSSDIQIDNLIPGTAAGNTINYVYAQLLGHTPYTTEVDFIASTTFFDSDVYLILGRVITNQNNEIVEIDVSESSGRMELTFLEFILSIIQDHLHTGAPGDPSKIDLQDHVKGILDASNIGNIPASKITGGTIPSQRFNISHEDLQDIGTLTHPEIDSLIEKLQNINRLLFGDLMTANLMQLFLSFKHVWPQVDEYTNNFLALIPGISPNDSLNPNSFIDLNATTAEVDFLNHRIRGRSLPAREVGQATISSEGDWRAGSFDERFIRILETNSAFGYGYGGGDGLDFFDVFQTNQFDFLTGTDSFISFAGNETGYGVTDLDGNDFESSHPGGYAFGYGFEYAVGFPTTLSSTIVTLNPLNQELDLHDKLLSDETATGNTYITSDTAAGFFVQNDDIPGGTTKGDFIRYLGQSIATVIPGGRRSDTIDPFNNGANNIPDDVYSFYSFVVESGTTGQITDSDRSAVYLMWENPVDMTLNNIINFRVTQAEDSGGDLTDYDENWTFDHSFQLIIESSSDTERAYYLFETSDSRNRFFIGDEYTDQTETAPLTSPGVQYFKEFGELLNGRNSFDLPAQLEAGTLTFITGYNINTSVELTTDPFLFTTLVQQITGVILYSDTSFGHDNKQENNLGATFPKFPQGRRERLQVFPGFDSSSRMLADLDKIFVGGPFGFGDDPNNNDIVDLIVSFPDRVDFSSISWISDEPGDSLVWIQANRLEEDSPTDYRIDPIYSNHTGTRINDEFFPGSEIRPSGSEFTDIFNNIRGIRLRVVLLPTSDRRVAPTINSITINYVTNTLSNTITISTKEDWLDARSIRNLTVSEDGEVSIEILNKANGKVKNVIYGTNRAIVEVDQDYRTTVKRYTGINLPTTVQQSLNAQPASLSGFITDLKKLNVGDIVALDRDENRVIFLDQDYNVEKIVASEKVYLTNEDAGAGPAGNTATLVKAIYNRELGDNGVLYLAFSHQLAAWRAGITTANVRPSQIFIKSKGLTLNLGDILVPGLEGADDDNIIVADRGILSFKLTAEIANFIESAQNPILQLFLDAASGAEPVIFEAASTVTTGRIDLSISKVGTKGIFQGINIIYAPIQGIVAFDLDDDDNLHILKSRQPYLFDTTADDDGIWYARFSTDRFWTSWNTTPVGGVLVDPNIETNTDTILGTSFDSSLDTPNFFVNNFFGNKGSIERFEDWLLITFSGDKKVFITKKEDQGGGDLKFRQPTEITLPDDGTTPMAARLDPVTTTSSDFTYVYVALSDLRRGATDNTGKSKVVKIQEGVVAGQEIVWSWGAGEDEQDTQAVTVNDVRPLVYATKDSVIVST